MNGDNVSEQGKCVGACSKWKMQNYVAAHLQCNAMRLIPLAPTCFSRSCTMSRDLAPQHFSMKGTFGLIRQCLHIARFSANACTSHISAACDAEPRPNETDPSPGNQ
mmetsp:Transcript_4217/g.8525  ORF Transcript_4217/g.8525 Transcript_4217/m.8525 type:complete len:107 (-) Transcript_4217:240-560(-)